MAILNIVAKLDKQYVLKDKLPLGLETIPMNSALSTTQNTTTDLP